LESDISGKRENFTNVYKKFFPTPMKIFYCSSLNHPRDDERFTKSAQFLFFEKPFCSHCKEEINHSDYILKFSLREQIHLKLLSLPKTVLEELKKKQNAQRNKKGESFEMESKIHDIDSGLLYFILRENCWFDDCDLSFTLLFNSDGVSLKRRSNKYKKVYPLWLAINDLPIELRFKKEFMILIGIYSGEKDASPSLFDLFVQEFNSAFYPFSVIVRGETFKIRALVLGSTLDGVEIPHLFNINAHNAYCECHICNLIGKSSGKSRYYLKK
jgi:hypothetical protein